MRRLNPQLNSNPFGIESDPRYWFAPEIPLEDRLLAGHLVSYDSYDEVMSNAKVRACFGLRTHGVTSREARISPGGDRRIDRKNAEWIEQCFSGIAMSNPVSAGVGSSQASLDFATEILMRAIIYGQSAIAPIWRPESGHYRLTGFQPLPPRRVRFGPRSLAPKRAQFHMGYGIRIITKKDQVWGEWLEMPYRLIVHTYGTAEGNPYGLGLGSILWWLCQFDKDGLKAWLINAHRTNGILLAKLSRLVSPGSEAYKALERFLKAIAPDNYLMAPEGTDISFLEANRSSRPVHAELIEHIESLIAQLITGQTGLLQQDGGGSRARDEVAERTSARFSQADSKAISFGPLATLCRWMTLLGPYPKAAPPTIVRSFEETENLNERAERDAKLAAAAGAQLDPQYVESTYGVKLVQSRTLATPATPDESLSFAAPVTLQSRTPQRSPNSSQVLAFATAIKDTVARRRKNWEAIQGAPYVRVVRNRPAVDQRIAHKDLEGKVFPNDPSFWRIYCFPLGYNCGHDLEPVGSDYTGDVESLPHELALATDDWRGYTEGLRREFELEVA